MTALWAVAMGRLGAPQAGLCQVGWWPEEAKDAGSGGDTQVLGRRGLLDQVGGLEHPSCFLCASGGRFAGQPGALITIPGAEPAWPGHSD